MTSRSTNPALDALKTEYQICRRKLESKCEALLILSKELDQCRSEKDQYKLMAEQLRDRYQMVKRQLTGDTPVSVTHSDVDPQGYSDTQAKSLARLLFDTKETNKSLKFERDDLKQKLQDAEGDIKLLREQIARSRVGTTDEGLNTRHFPAHEREDLVRQLEASREEIVQQERDLQQVLDEKEELVTERDAYRTKYDRLNRELNYILRGDEKRIVDIDALSMENKFLQERLKQIEEEKTMAIATVTKYKSILEKKKAKGILKLGQSRSGGLVITQKQVHQIIQSRSSISATPQAVADLQGLCGALLDTINDKNLALSHQRKTNKILGNRVSELEKKLKTLEVSGLWSVSGNGPNIGKLIAECEAIKTLVPRQFSHSSEISDTAKDISDFESEISSSVPNSANPSPVHEQKKVSNLNKLNFEELDLLPTKEEAVRENASDSAHVSLDTDCLDSSGSLDLVTGFTSDMNESSIEFSDLENLQNESHQTLNHDYNFITSDARSRAPMLRDWEQSLAHYLKTGQLEKESMSEAEDSVEEDAVNEASKDEQETQSSVGCKWMQGEDEEEEEGEEEDDELGREDYGEANEHIKALMDCVTTKLLNSTSSGKALLKQETPAKTTGDMRGNLSEVAHEVEKVTRVGENTNLLDTLPVSNEAARCPGDAERQGQQNLGFTGIQNHDSSDPQQSSYPNETKELTDPDCSVVDC